jgi:D-3-phosphoglycerate dehydrogenase
MPKVLITDHRFESLEVEKTILDQAGCHVVEGQHTTPESLRAALAEVDYAITQFSPFTADVVASMNRCRMIVRYGVGVDNIDLDAARKHGIPVCNVPDYCMDEVADHALGLILGLTRQIVSISNHVKEGFWKLPVPLDQMRVLKELTVGVAGFGRIGREVAVRLKAFKCKVLVFDPVVPAHKIVEAGCTPTSLEMLLHDSDLITLHCPSTGETRGMFHAGTFAKMKTGALLVNVARGDLVHTDALIQALHDGQIGGAALDVTDPEPPKRDSPLLRMRNVLITNHVAAASISAIRTLRTRAAQAVVCAVRGEPLPNVVNGVNSLPRR